MQQYIVFIYYLFVIQPPRIIRNDWKNHEGASQRLKQGYDAVKMNGCGPMNWIGTIKEVNEVNCNLICVRQMPLFRIEIDEQVVKEMAVKGHDWHNPVWRTDDGVIAEW